MIIIYHKKSGKILASFPAIYEFKKGVDVSGWDEGPEAFDKFVLGPEESYDFEDPRNPKNIHDYRVILKNGEPQGIEEIK
jgi:hypothetical protein